MTIKMTEFQQENHTIWGGVREISDEKGVYEKGDWRMRNDYIPTACGLVISRRYYDHISESTLIFFVHNGREYTRRWAKWWGDRTITRLARVMVAEIAKPT